MLKLALVSAALLLIPDQMPVPAHVGGRVDADMRFGWPGVYFEGRFKGTDVTVAVETGTEHLRVLVDGQERAVLTRAGIATLKIAGLAAGEHVVRVEKLTESQSGGGRFLYFHTGGVALPPRPRKRRIEFIGDSFTVGYGNTSPSRECDGRHVHDTTDTSKAFGPLTAKRLDADYRIIAYSGYGIVRNYAGNKAGESLPFLYPRVLPGEPGIATDTKWRPQVIVINLGTNDFSTPVKPGEPWADAAALRQDYRARYVSFVQSLKQAQPQARVILMGADNFYADVEAIAAQVGAVPLRFGGLELTACNGHPSLKDHRALADLVEGAIGTLD